jgi:hypothetical protein
MVMTTLTAATLAGMPARGDVWGIAPRASLVSGYDQNVQLAVDGDEGQGGGAVQVGARAVRHGDTTNWSLDPELLVVRYPENRKLNRDQANVIGSFIKYFDRGEWANTVSYGYDTTIISERGASGLTESNLPHERVVLTTKPSRRLSDVWTADATVAWSADDYDEGESVGLVDYDYTSIGGQLSYSMTERTSLGVGVSYGRLDIPSRSDTTAQYAANVRVDTAINELWQASIGGGPLRVVSGDVSDPGIGLSMNLQRRSETSSFSIDLSNDTIPDGRGTLSRRTVAAASFSRDLSSRLATELSANWVLTRDALPAVGVDLGTVTYWNVTPVLRWRAAPTVSVSFSMTWSRQERENMTGDADAYRAALTLSWAGLERVY